LTSLDLGSSQMLNSESDLTWPRSFYLKLNSIFFATHLRLKKKESTLNGEISVMLLMKFSPKKDLRKQSIWFLMIAEPRPYTEDRNLKR